jgi:two-component system, sensor histidine kinase PdtaS
MVFHQSNSPSIARDLASVLVESFTTPALLLDGDLHVLAASRSFCAAFRIDPLTLTGCLLSELGKGEWNVPQLSSLLRVTASGVAEIGGYEMSLAHQGRAPRQLVLNAKNLQHAETWEVRLLLTVCDVTDARKTEKLKDDLLLEKEILLKELHHRVANSLQIVASVLMQSARNVKSEEARGHLCDAHQRVMSVAALQKQLMVSGPNEIELRAYFSALCECIGASMIRDRGALCLAVHIDESFASADVAMSLGLIVTELLINAIKHAFPDNRCGRIWIDCRSLGDNWTLSVRDDGVGISVNAAAAHSGLGTSIVRALAKQLGADIKITAVNPGTAISIEHAYAPAIVRNARAAMHAV